MNLPRHQVVSDTLHLIADLIQEANSYLSESNLFQSSVKPVPKPKAAGLKPYASSAIDLAGRKLREKLNPPERDIFRAKRERKARSRYHTLKSVIAPPRKALGSRMRKI